MLNLFGDLEDLETALNKKNNTKVVGSGSCSAIVKLFPKNAELAISHVTWNDFNAMLRIYKRYNFSMKSYPGGKLLLRRLLSLFKLYILIYKKKSF